MSVLENGRLSFRKTYRSQNGSAFFTFEFVRHRGHIDIYCTSHPSLNGRDSDPHKTHLFPSGKICFVSGREPTSESRAKELAAQWAEYWIEYARTGIPQS